MFIDRSKFRIFLKTHPGNISLIDWLKGVLRCFQQYFSHITAADHIIHVFPTFHQYYTGLWSVLPKDTPTKKPRGSSAAWTQDSWITSQRLYHWDTWDPHFWEIISISDQLTFFKSVIVNNFRQGSPKEHSCEITSKSDQRFQRRFLKNCLENSNSLPWQSEFLDGIQLWTIFREDLPRNIPTKFGPNWPCCFRWEDV